MKKFVIFLIFLLIMAVGGYYLYKYETSDARIKIPGKVLVVYFSRSGNTEIVAKIIAQKTKADLFKIEVQPGHYPENNNEIINFAAAETKQQARPALAKKIDNFDKYNVIFIGYPNWFGDKPMPVYTFMDSYNLANKKVYEFCTHGTTGPVEGAFGLSGETVLTDIKSATRQIFWWLRSLK